MAKNSSTLALPDNVFAMLADADKQRGFPAGTMQALLMQETGGQAQYLSDPTTYHYGLNADGKRVAAHTGKVSTAFGPFGILESTAKDPGYGVKPLADKANLAEHIRFAADYLDARSKSAGSLSAGLAGYGEGAKYSTQVARRMVNVPVKEAPVAVAAAPVVTQTPAVLSVQNSSTPTPTQAPTVVAQAPVAPTEAAPVQVAATIPEAKPVDPLYAYQPKPYQNPDFMAALSGLVQASVPNFNSFDSFGKRGRA